MARLFKMSAFRNSSSVKMQFINPFEFEQDLWCQKTRVPGLLFGAGCVVTCSATLIEHWLVLNSQTDTTRYHIPHYAYALHGTPIGLTNLGPAKGGQTSTVTGQRKFKGFIITEYCVKSQLGFEKWHKLIF